MGKLYESRFAHGEALRVMGKLYESLGRSKTRIAKPHARKKAPKRRQKRANTHAQAEIETQY